MKQRWRTPVLLALAILNVAVIGFLGYTIISRGRAAPNVTAVPPLCSQIILTDLESYLSPAVAWDAEQLTVMLTAFYAAPDPPEASAQLLWEALDSVRRAAALNCALPPKITLRVQAHGKSSTVGHVALFSGADIGAWANGNLAETELVQRGAYWRNAETDQAPTPTD